MAVIPVMAQDFSFGESISKFSSEMGFTAFFVGDGWKNAVMICIGCFLLYLAIKKEYEPLLLLPIAFGMILTNLPGAGLFHTSMWNDEFLNPESSFVVYMKDNERGIIARNAIDGYLTNLKIETLIE